MRREIVRRYTERGHRLRLWGRMNIDDNTWYIMCHDCGEVMEFYEDTLTTTGLPEICKRKIGT